ncbi:MAG TPA: MarR family transcriptional regulator [Lysobacter sp.]|jgi:DNA-binding MarR family transcriptional regulator|nr:MarR family transcriptional regulator [Lysobacter sp.]
MSTKPSKDTPGKSERKLSDFLCFAIYSANLAFGKAYRPILDRLGLTYTQYITLICLSERDHQTVRELGQNLFLESNTLTPILKKLEEMGYVNRERGTADERQVVVSLTDSGRRLRERAGANNLVGATGLTPQEFKTLQKAVSRLRDSLIDSVKAQA